MCSSPEKIDLDNEKAHAKKALNVKMNFSQADKSWRRLMNAIHVGSTRKT